MHRTITTVLGMMNDGLTKEFYVAFFRDLGKTLASTLNCSFDKGSLSSSQKQPIVTIIEKKGKIIGLVET